MKIGDLNERSVEELEDLHEKKGYLYMINDGRILWYWEDDEGQ